MKLGTGSIDPGIVKRDSRSLLSFLGVVIVSAGFILGTFVVSYRNWSPNGLPIGWDTPHYAGGAAIAASQGLQALLSVQGPYDFFYQAFEGLLVWVGIPALSLEVYLPLILISSFPYLLGRLGQIYSGTRFGALVAASTPCWYAVYRLPADLHANLLALTLLFVALIMLSKVKQPLDRRFLAALSIVGVASFTHIETTLFLVGILLCSSLSKVRLLTLKAATMAVAVTIPATLFYLIHLLALARVSGGTLSSSGTLSLDMLLAPLLPVLPLAIIGLVWTTIRPRSPLERLASVWATLGLSVGFSQFAFPQVEEFAFRAILLVPIPFLAAVAIRELSTSLGKQVPRLAAISSQSVKLGVTIILLTLLVASWPAVYGNAAQFHRVYISSSQYSDLEWVHANLKFSTSPIFVVNDFDQYAGELGRLYDYWISATVGPHISYLGLVDYLAQLRETPFNNSLSKTMSGIFMQQIHDSGINSKDALSQHAVIIVGSIYRPFPLPVYTAELFQQVGSDVYVANSTKLASVSNTTLPLYSTFLTHSGDWHGNPEPWARSLSAYEVNDTITPRVEASFLIGVPSSATYTLGLRFWDGRGNGFALSLDGATIGIVTYDNSDSPRNIQFGGIMLTPGNHIVDVAVSNTPTSVRYTALDYLTVTNS